jgi:DNA primase
LIAKESIEALKARLDIVDVVGSYIELRKNGANFKAPCPFHDEKTPSFVVSPSKQIYHCFGCGAGGDAIKFVMDYEHLSYPEAIEKLASTYGFRLNYTTAQKKQNSDILEKINEYYQSLLPHNQTAMNYLKERGVYESSIEKFAIGYAPSSTQTIEWIQKNFFSMQDALKFGIIGSDGNRSYARFIERITFPIYSSSSRVVGFGGRTITGHQAKYINSPQTPIFDKSRLLYAYNLARGEIYKKKQIIITEGYLDVIMLHQAGFENAVATLGTALTNEHLPLLRKGEPKVIMAYDGDNAGINAALKASKLLSSAGFDGGVVIFDGGMDPADMVKNSQIDKLKELFDSPKPFIEFVIDMILSRYNLNEPKAKEASLAEVSGFLKTLSALMQEEYKPYIASKLGISPSFIKLKNDNLSQPQNQIKNQYKDLWELTLIKTVLEHEEFIDKILDVFDASLMQYHRFEFELALQNQKNHPKILDILLDDDIKALNSFEELKNELITFLIRHYERELKKINFSKDINFEKKAFFIRKFRDKITRLKKGELVSLN